MWNVRSFFTEISCPALEKLEFGKVTCSENYNYKSECQFECDNGYKLLGNAKLQCRHNATWDVSPPYCESTPDYIICRISFAYGSAACSVGKMIPYALWRYSVGPACSTSWFEIFVILGHAIQSYEMCKLKALLFEKWLVPKLQDLSNWRNSAAILDRYPCVLAFAVVISLHWRSSFSNQNSRKLARAGQNRITQALDYKSVISVLYLHSWSEDTKSKGQKVCVSEGSRTA